MNLALIVASSAVFIYELTLSGRANEALAFDFGLIPDRLVHGGRMYLSSPVPGWATLFTSMFLHGSWGHILSNMIFLWVFGNNVEARFGHFRYLLFYLAAGLAAGLAQVLPDASFPYPIIGASGAIAGVLGAYFLMYPYSRVRVAIFLIIVSVIRIPAVYLLGFWFLLQFLGSLGSILDPSGGGVAYMAHVGGFLFGLIVVTSYKAATRQRVWPGKFIPGCDEPANLKSRARSERR
ncbi:MAG: rhomboid family intramembrane serine protease [Chloroflexi bacterium]|nr:rhomboid family intramembrane serine protease [Chloroflexota bacterium]